jgi:hypothetical protein
LPEDPNLLVAACACGQKMKVPGSAVGKTYKCVRCGEHLTVSDVNTQATGAPGGRLASLFQASGPEPVGQLLLKSGVITQAQLDEALVMQEEKGGKTFENLMWLGYLHKDQLHEILSRQSGIASIDLSRVSIDRELIQLIPRKLALENLVLPIDRLGKLLSVAMACPIDLVTIAEVERLTGLKVKALLCKLDDIHAAVQRYYPLEGEGMFTIEMNSLPGLWEEPSKKVATETAETAPAPETLKKVRQGGQGAAQLADVLAADAGAAAMVVRAANGAVYGLQGQIESVAMAVVVLGVEGVAALFHEASAAAPTAVRR